MEKRFSIKEKMINCNNHPITNKEAVYLLNEADSIIFNLKKAFNYCIMHNVDLLEFENDDELFLYLEEIGVI